MKKAAGFILFFVGAGLVFIDIRVKSEKFVVDDYGNVIPKNSYFLESSGNTFTDVFSHIGYYSFSILGIILILLSNIFFKKKVEKDE